MIPRALRRRLPALGGLVRPRLSRGAVASVGATVTIAAASAPARPAPVPRALVSRRAGIVLAPVTAPAPGPAPAGVERASGVAREPSPAGESDARVGLLRACAPAVDPATLLAVIEVESGGDPLAVNINGGPRVSPRTVEEAVATAEAAIAAGYSVDLGLMQVNSRNLNLLGVTLPAMFDACENLHAGSAILADAYAAAARTYGEGQPALRAALSAYNTGDFARGFANGYVARYFRGAPASGRAAALVPVNDGTPTRGTAAHAAGVEPFGDAPNPYTASPTVYTRTTWATTPASSAAPPPADPHGAPP